MQTVEQNGQPFVTELDKLEFLECYLFLTTQPMNEIMINRKGRRLSGLSNAIASVELYHPVNPVSVILDNHYWVNYSWVWNITDQGCVHFKMTHKTEYPIPPVPQSLYDLWQQYRAK